MCTDCGYIRRSFKPKLAEVDYSLRFTFCTYMHLKRGLPQIEFQLNIAIEAGSRVKAELRHSAACDQYDVATAIAC